MLKVYGIDQSKTLCRAQKNIFHLYEFKFAFNLHTEMIQSPYRIGLQSNSNLIAPITHKYFGRPLYLLWSHIWESYHEYRHVGTYNRPFYIVCLLLICTFIT